MYMRLGVEYAYEVYQALLNKQLEQGKQARLTRTGGVF